MNRLTVFAKGNLDVRDSLHSLRAGEAVLWNGLGDVLRLRDPPVRVRVRHETWTRSDALLEASGAPPPSLSARRPALGAHTLESQYSQAVFDAGADAVVLSIQPDVCLPMARHRQEGFLFHPDGWRNWPPEAHAWLAESFGVEPMLDAEASMANFSRIIERIRAASAAPILIYNVSAIAPGDWTHAYDGLEENFSERARRFNLALIDLSRRTGISIVDVDRIVAWGGAERLTHDAMHLTAAGCQAVAEAVAAILEDLGVLAASKAPA